MSDDRKKSITKEKKKKGWFARLVERIARDNEKAGGRVCPT